MLTPQDAERALREYFREHPPSLMGQLHFTGTWWEDDQDYLLTWGSREFLVEGREAFARWDNLAYFVDKQTGAVRTELFNASLRKIQQMTEHSADEAKA